MAIDQEKIRWASVDENDPTTGNPNKLPPSTEFKNSGAKFNQPVPRQLINNQFNEQYNALVELQAQIDAIVGGSSQPTLMAVYPVGSYYTTNSSDNPNTTFGFGTWVQVQGKLVIGVDTGDVDFDTPNKTGGSKTHSHTDTFSIDGHAITEAELPPHDHNTTIETATAGSGTGTTVNLKETGDGSGTEVFTTTSVGSGDTHTHPLSGGTQSASSLAPFHCAYIWYRSA